MISLMENELKAAIVALRQNAPLIHCITNHIAINDCANLVLALGARPIMAEHPGECADITAHSSALALNLGNISDSRMAAMRISAETAMQQHIPYVIDVVGVACSSLRLDFAREITAKFKPNVIKGNCSELRAMLGLPTKAHGVDSAEEGDVRSAQQLSKQTGALVVMSGREDVVTDGRTTYAVDNGCELMGRLTGTGCMLNVAIAAYMAVLPPAKAALTAAAVLGICGEMAEREAKGTGTFRAALLDAACSITDWEFGKFYQIKEL